MKTKKDIPLFLKIGIGSILILLNIVCYAVEDRSNEIYESLKRDYLQLKKQHVDNEKKVIVQNPDIKNISGITEIIKKLQQASQPQQGNSDEILKKGLRLWQEIENIPQDSNFNISKQRALNEEKSKAKLGIPKELSLDLYSKIYDGCIDNACKRNSYTEPLVDDYKKRMGIKHDIDTKYVLSDMLQSIKFASEMLSVIQQADTHFKKNELDKVEVIYKNFLHKAFKELPSGHVNTFMALDLLANFYFNMGQYTKAEQTYLDYPPFASELRQPYSGKTITSFTNLAIVYRSQGRLGEAGHLLRKLLKLSWEIEGENNEAALAIQSHLASIYNLEGRHNEAMYLLKDLFKRTKEILPHDHHFILSTLTNLAITFQGLEKYKIAEKIYTRLSKIIYQHLGNANKDWLAVQHNLGHLYYIQGHYAESEKIARETLTLHKKLHKSNVLLNLNALCSTLSWQNKRQEALEFCQEAYLLAKQQFIASHPYTLTTVLNYVYSLMKKGEFQTSLALLIKYEEAFLQRAKQHIYTLESKRSQRYLLVGLSDYQDLVFSLYEKMPKNYQAQQLAINTVLRWKSLQKEEKAIIHKNSQQSSDKATKLLLKTIIKQRREVTQYTYAKSNPQIFKQLIQALEENETKLSQHSPSYQQHLRVFNATQHSVQQHIPANAILIEFRQYRPLTNKNPVDFVAPHWLVLVMNHEEVLFFADIGEKLIIEKSWNTLKTALACWQSAWKAKKNNTKLIQCTQQANVHAKQLYSQLFGRIDNFLQKAKTIYIAPDSFLNQIPFNSLRLPDGRYWIERQTLVQLQSGRDLLKPTISNNNHRIVALGNVNYKSKPASIMTEQLASSIFLPKSFPRLNQTKNEIKAIQTAYTNTNHKVEALLGKQATEQQLKQALEKPANIVHFATHAFFTNGNKVLQQKSPLLFSGIALAGASHARRGGKDKHGDDGILFAQEILELNLSKTKLVVLSACDTALGVEDYSEGIYGLIRAFNIAGAQSLIMTLWQLDDKYATAFMERFYQKWVKTPLISPAEHLRQVQLDFIHNKVSKKIENFPYQSDPNIWAAYTFTGRY